MPLFFWDVSSKLPTCVDDILFTHSQGKQFFFDCLILKTKYVGFFKILVNVYML